MGKALVGVLGIVFDHIHPGYSVVIMTLIASIVTILPPKPESKKTRALLILIFVFGVLSSLELLVIYHDQAAQELRYTATLDHFAKIERSLQDLNSVNYAICKTQNEGAKPASLKLRALQLSREILNFVYLRSQNRPYLTVPTGADRTLYEFKIQSFQRQQDQFNQDIRAYWSDHFSDNVTKMVLELRKQNVFSGDVCQNPLFLEMYANCANHIKDSALKLPLN